MKAPAKTQRDLGASKKRSSLSVFSSILFYLTLVVILIAVFAYSQGGSNGKDVLGYRFYTVLTTSMDLVIPRGSLVITKSVDPQTLSVGQDITFYQDNDTIVTHRIEAIDEDNGHLLFTTKGVDNKSPDPRPVFDDNIVGKVVFHIPVVGVVLTTIADNMLWVAGGLAVLLLMSFSLRLLLTKDDKKTTDKRFPTPLE